MGKFAWVTLATNDSYSMGALVLAHSLRRVNTVHHLVVLITPGVSEAMKTQLSAVFNVVKLVDVLDSRDAENLSLLARPELGITFTKLHCWKLTEYEKCVFLDADTLVLQNSDELFEREELSAAPDAGWPDCFNSGVFVYKPSQETFQALIEFALVHGSFDGGDQGLLNLFFSDWPTKDIKKHLPFVYNMCSTATYSYLPAFKQFGAGLKIIHFIGAAKPWLQPFNTETGLVSVSGESSHIVQFVQLWWDTFCAHVHPTLSTEMTWHRLKTSLEFFFRPPPPLILLSEQYYVKQRPQSPLPPSAEANQQDEQKHGYFDPWDEYLEQNDKHMSQESYINYNNTVDSYFRPNNSSEINYGDHHSIFSSSQSSNEHSDSRNSFSKPHLDEHSVSHHSHTSNHDSHIYHSHTHSQPSHDHPRFAPSPPRISEPTGWGRSNQSDVFSVTGGGRLLVHTTTSRKSSFSQSEQSQSVPEIRVTQPLIEHSFPHEPPALPIHEPSHCESSSVDCHTQQHSSSAQSDHETGLAGALATVTLGAPLTVEQRALEEHLRRQGWEQGNIDYMGKDSFANIWQKICETLGTKAPTTPAPPPEEAPAPVAPLAAPLYVSSVEISPSGQIDKTPPQANYAPVSALIPTVEASDTKDATKAPISEPPTVVPEPKPSVTEVVSTEASITPSATLESSTTPLITSEPPAAQPPVAPVEADLKTETAPEATITPSTLPTTAVPEEATITAPAQTSITAPPPTSPTPVPAPTESSTIITSVSPTPVPTSPSPVATPVPTTPTSVPTTPIPAPTTLTTVSTPTEPSITPTTPIPVPTTQTTVPATTEPSITPTPAPTTPIPAPTTLTTAPTPIEASTTPTIVPTPPTTVPTLTEATTTPTPAPTTPTPTPTTPTTASTTPTTVPTPTEASTTPTLVPTPPTIVPTLTEAITTPTPAPTTPVSSPIEATSTPTLPPVQTTPTQTPTVPIPAPTNQSPVPTAIQAPIPTPTDPLVSSTPAPPPVETNPSVPTTAPAEVTPATGTPVSTPTEPSAPAPAVPVSSSAAQPQTPTVTGPTPPTSPPVAAEAPQLTKLQVEPEVPSTPPVGGSAQPSLEGAVADEPPVPPKRKGGSKGAQDSKNQKAGKPTKGKK